MAFIPLYVDGKRDSARRYVDESNPSNIISRRQFDNLSGKIAVRPSSGKRFIPQVDNLATTTTNKQQVSTKLSSKPPSRYATDIDNYARKHNMRKQDARRDPQFKLLNKEFSQKLKKRDALINEIEFRKRKKEDASNLIKQKNDLDEQLGHLAREIGRKRADDFSQFGSTP